MAKKTEGKQKMAVGPVSPKAPSPAIAAAATARRSLKGLLTRRIKEAQARKVLLFISTGDTCRGPMAAGYFRKLLEDRKVRNWEVRSAGVMTIPGLLATDESKLMLEPYGVSLDRHRSQPLTEDMLRRAELVLGMTPFHVQTVLRMIEDVRGKTDLIKEYTRTDPKGRPIPDPMGCTLEVYKKVFRQIKQSCDTLVEMPVITGKEVRPKAARKGAAARKSKKLARARKAELAAAEASAGKKRASR